MKKEKLSTREISNVTFRRFFKLESSCLFIYPIAVLFKRFITHSSVREPYLSADGIFRPVYILLDATGLANLFGTPMLNITWWYLSYAILIIFSVPVIYLFYEKFGLFSIAFILLIKPEILSIFLGVVFAKSNIFDKIDIIVQKNLKTRIVSGLISVFLLYFSYQLVAGRKQIGEVEGWGCVLWAYIVIEYISRIPLISNLLKEIGKYSGNIFLIHTYIYLYFYNDFGVSP